MTAVENPVDLCQYFGEKEGVGTLSVVSRPGKAVTLLTVIQIYAHDFVRLLEDLRTLQDQASYYLNLSADDPQLDHAVSIMNSVRGYCKELRLRSSQKQLDYMQGQGAMAKRGERQKVSASETSVMLAELHRRVLEDLEDQIYFCIYDHTTLERFFKTEQDEFFGAVLTLKPAEKLFPEIVVGRFPATIPDIEDACRCFYMNRFTASVFHLMRIVEIGVLKLAQLIQHPDPKPSWGSILKKVEKYALYTEYKDLPTAIQPHVDFLRMVLPHMQSVQRAWRNHVSHVEDRIIPSNEKITLEDAEDIMKATESLMRYLAEELPATTNPSSPTAP